MDGRPDPLFARATWGFLPPAGGDASVQLRACLDELRDRLESAGLTDREVLRLTFFVDVEVGRGYASLKSALKRALKKTLGALPPPVSFAAQPPERGRRVALEAAVLTSPGPDFVVRRKELDGSTYSVVESRGFREVHGAGLASDGRASNASAQARQAFERMSAVLEKERLTFGHVVRQWSYIEDIVGFRTVGGWRRQNYQAFNDVRTLYYGRSDFPSGYPAATGIGQGAGGVILEFTALEAPAGVRVVPLSNPYQVDAYRYSAGVLVGSPIGEMPEKSSPKFERAKLVARGDSGVVYVSGTAAVLGQKSVGCGDVESQGRTTVRNIAALVGRESLARAGIAADPAYGALSYLRAYVKRESDIPKVRRVCERAFGRIPSLFVRADVCRPELLVEIEGIKIVSVA